MRPFLALVLLFVAASLSAQGKFRELLNAKPPDEPLAYSWPPPWIAVTSGAPLLDA